MMERIVRFNWRFCSAQHKDYFAGWRTFAELRWAASSRGKRGGLRPIYYWEPESETFYLLYLYAKNEQRDLTSAQLKVLAKLVREEFK